MDMCRGVPVECSCSCYKAKKPAVVCLSSPLLLVYAHLVVDDVLDPDGDRASTGSGPNTHRFLANPMGSPLDLPNHSFVAAGRCLTLPHRARMPPVD